MITPIPVTASTEAVIYPTKSIKVQTEVVRVTRASPTVWITSSSDALSSSSSGVPDVREQHNSTSSNANDPQTAKNNGVEATGTTFDKTDERVLISVGSIGTDSRRLENQRLIANICRRWFCSCMLSDLDCQEGNQESDATSVKGDWRHP